MTKRRSESERRFLKPGRLSDEKSDSRFAYAYFLRRASSAFSSSYSSFGTRLPTCA